MIRPLILFLPSWYPNRTAPTNGNFVYNHARVASRVADLAVLYVQPDSDCKQFELLDNSSDGFREILIYYPKAATKIGGLFRFFKYRLHGWRYIKKRLGKPKLVHVHVAFPAGLFALWLKFFSNVKYMVTEHWSGYLSQNNERMPWLHKLIFKYSSLNTAVSKHLAGDLKKLTATAGWRIMPNVVINTFYKKQDADNRSKTILHISNFAPVKNAMKIIQGLEDFLMENTDVKLFMIGEESSDKEVCKLYVQSKPGLANKVRFEDVMEPANIAALMRNATCLVSFSDYETQGITVLEALACGLPVVSSNIAPMNKYNLEGLVIAKNVEDISRQVEYLLSHPQLADSVEMAEFTAKFSEETLVRKFKKTYSEVL